MMCEDKMSVIWLVLQLLLLCHQTASTQCGPSWSEWNCQCYFLSDIHLDWHTADEACKSMDASLVSIDNQEHMDLVNSMLTGDIKSLWAGLNLNTSLEKDFKGANGTCVEINLYEDVLDDNMVSCDIAQKFICIKGQEIDEAIAPYMTTPEVYPQAFSAVLYWNNWPVFDGCRRSVTLNIGNNSMSIFGPNQTSDFSYEITGLEPLNFYSLVAEFSNGNRLWWNELVINTTAMENLTSSIEFGCENGWESFQSHCYQLSTDKTTWGSGRSTCQKKGGELASIHSLQEQQFVSSMHTKQVWLGIHDQYSEGSYRWSDGSPLDYTYWHAGEPNADIYEDCIENAKWGSATKWNDVPCTWHWQYICKKPGMFKDMTAPTVHVEDKQTFLYWEKSSRSVNIEVTNIRTREQWIVEGDSNNYILTIKNLPPQEFQFFRSVPILNDRKELQYEKQSVFLTPSCDECEPTEEELEEGCPAVFSCPLGWISNGCECYKFFDHAMSWNDARYLCTDHASNILSILSMEEQQFIDEYISEDEVWLGLTDTHTENTFNWQDSSPFHFAYWDETQPDNGGERPEGDVGSGETYGSGHGEDNFYWDYESYYYGSEESPFYESSGMGSGFRGIDDEDGITTEFSSTAENCVSKGSVYKNNGRWNDINCKEKRKVVCKQKIALVNALRPSVFVQESMVQIQWKGTCKCPTYVDIVYSRKDTDNNKRLAAHHKAIENGTNITDDLYGLEPLTMYRIDIYAASDDALGNRFERTSVLFRTPGVYPEEPLPSTAYPAIPTKYEEQTPYTTYQVSMTTLPPTTQYEEQTHTTYEVPVSTSPPTTYPPFSSSVSSTPVATCGAGPSSAVAFSFAMSCGNDGKPGSHLSYTFMNANGQHTEYQMLCEASDTSGATMSCTTSSAPVVP